MNIKNKLKRIFHKHKYIRITELHTFDGGISSCVIYQCEICGKRIIKHYDIY